MYFAFIPIFLNFTGKIPLLTGKGFRADRAHNIFAQN